MSNEEKKFMKLLGEAINDSIGESDRIAEVIWEIRRAGYDIFLVFEARVGFSKREESEEELEKKKKMEEYDKTHNGKPAQIKFTFEDNRFLDALKIVDPDREKKSNKEK
jgi:hypothetical protein